MRRVVVTGLGAVTPLGVGIQRTWTRLLAGESGIVSTRHLGEEFTRLPSQVAGLVPLGKLVDGGWDAAEHVSREESHKTALFTQYALAATAEALDSAEWHPTTAHSLNRTGITLGTGIGNLDVLYDTSLAYSNSRSSSGLSSSFAGQNNYKAIHPLFIPRLLPNLAAGILSLRFGFRGPNHCVSTACTTGAHSIGDAMRFIQHGAADVMVAGSSESCIHPLALGGFARMRALSTNFNDDPCKASRPFDRDRDGFVISEGGGVLVLEELEHALARGVGDKILAEVVGYGCSGDAWHVTSPRGDGDGAARAMSMAMGEGGVRVGEVGYVNAHATGTGLGDRAENRAIRGVFLGGGEGDWKDGKGDGEKRRKRKLRVSSTKGSIGHLLGGAGSVEAIFAVLAVKTGWVPPSLNLGHFDEEGIGGTEGKERIEGEEGAEKEEGEWDDRIDYVPFREGVGEVHKGEVHKGEVHKGEVHKGEVHKGEVHKGEVHKGEVHKGEVHKGEVHKGEVGVALSNSFGFGGTNACLAFRRWEG